MGGKGNYPKNIIQKKKLVANLWVLDILVISTTSNVATKILRVALYIQIMIQF
jgi:hypothetical protein